MEPDYLSRGRSVAEWNFLLQHSSCNISTFRSNNGGFNGILMYQSVSALLHFGESITFRRLRVRCFQTSLAVLGGLCISSSCVSSNSFVQVSGQSCHRSSQTWYPCRTLFGGSSLAFLCYQHVGRCSSSVSHGKRSHQLCLCTLNAQWPASPYLTLGSSKKCCTDKSSLPHCVTQWQSDLNIYNKDLQGMLERIGRLMCLLGLTKQ